MVKSVTSIHGTQSVIEYTPEELFKRRDDWYRICEQNPSTLFGGYPKGLSPQKLIDEERWPTLRILIMQEIEHVRQGLDQHELSYSSKGTGAIPEVIEAWGYPVDSTYH